MLENLTGTDKILKFTDIIEEMIYHFKMKKNTDLPIERIDETHYLFGTKKIQAKVLNGILLVRVGGGYMDMDTFFNNYGELELSKHQR